jgi:hypothetical protein
MPFVRRIQRRLQKAPECCCSQQPFNTVEISCSTPLFSFAQTDYYKCPTGYQKKTPEHGLWQQLFNTVVQFAQTDYPTNQILPHYKNFDGSSCHSWHK